MNRMKTYLLLAALTSLLLVAGQAMGGRSGLILALTFGVGTVLMPFFIMQPAFGLGFAASKTSNPMQARLRSLMNHAAFGIGLYLFGLLINWLLHVYA